MVTIQAGFDEAQKTQVCALYWEAFGEKLATVLGPRERAMSFLLTVVDPKYVLCAVNEHGEVLGVAGYKTAHGAFVGGTMQNLIDVYGILGTSWRVPLLMLLERDVEPNRLLMDGICVRADARGRGVGTMLLDAIIECARALQLKQVRLDVIDKNRRARALYERQGFVAAETSSHAWLEPLFGFKEATTMVFTLTV